MNNILLTGATGVVGSSILNELIKNPDNTIYVLVRAKDEQSLKARLDSVYQFYGMDSTNKNIIPIMGDISQVNLGMSKEQLAPLRKKISTVIHSAASVKMNQTIEQARLNAFGGTQAVFEFAKSCEHLQKISYISTLGVNGKSTNILRETYPPEKIQYHNTYEQAKAESEFYIFEKWYNSLPVVIIRPSMVVGNSSTGAMYSKQIFYYLCQYLLNGDGSGFQPKLNHFFLDTIPVDYLGRFTAQVSTDNSIKHAIFNACSSYKDATSLQVIRSMLINSCEAKHQGTKKMLPLPLPVYQGLIRIVSLFASQKTKNEIKQLSYFLEYLKNSPRFANEDYIKQCKSYNLDLHPPQEYLPHVLKNCI